MNCNDCSEDLYYLKKKDQISNRTNLKVDQMAKKAGESRVPGWGIKERPILICIRL